MQKRFGFETDLLKGQKGVFEVTFDDELIFSKKSLGRFPEADEVENAIAQRLG